MSAIPRVRYIGANIRIEDCRGIAGANEGCIHIENIVAAEQQFSYMSNGLFEMSMDGVPVFKTHIPDGTSRIYCPEGVDYSLALAELLMLPHGNIVIHIYRK